MSIFEVFILSLIEGLTEFIPVSSTGHLIIANHFLNIQPSDFTKAFDVIIQFGAIIAVFFLYRDRLKWNLEFYKKILLAFIPTAIISVIPSARAIDLRDQPSRMNQFATGATGLSSFATT